MIKEANIFGNFTNHSLRGTGTTMLFDSGTPEAIVQKHTGHRSLSALRMYERVTPQQQAMVYNSNTPFPESEQANTRKANTSPGCNEEASTSFNPSSYESDPDISYSADDMEVFPNLVTEMDI